MKRLILPLVFVSILTAGFLLRPEAPAPGPDQELLRPAPPHAAPSRKQTGGPESRQAWETMRLADPATGRIPADIHHLEQEFAAKLPARTGGSFAGELPGILSGQLSGKLSGEIPAQKLAGWTYRGPWNIGGRTRALAIDLADAGYQTLLAGGISGGMWRTTDEGDSWTLTTGSSQLHSVTCIAQDTRPGQQNVWYYGTGELRGNSAGASGASYRGDGIFKSLDGGLTWSLLPATAAAEETSWAGEWQYVHRIAVDTSNTAQDEIYAAVYGYIQRSVDGGATWARVLGTDTYQADYTDVVVTADGVVYATLSSDGEQQGVFRSPDGLTWTDITPAGLTSFSRLVLALAPSDETIMYLSVSDLNGSSEEGFYKYQYLSGDGSGAGGTWDDRSARMAALPGPYGDEPMQFYGSYCQTLTVHPTNPDVVYLGGIHLIRSTDGFATGNQVSWIGGWLYDGHHADQHWLVFRPGSSSVAYSGSDGGVHRTLDIGSGNVTWTSLSNGYNTSQFYTVAIDENLPGSDVIIGGMQDNGTWFTSSTVATQPWVELLSGDGSFCAVVDASGDEGSYVVSAQNGLVYRITADNDTGSWLTWTRIDPTGGAGYLFINPLMVDPNQPTRLFVGSGNGVWRNSDISTIPLWSNDTTSENWDQLTTVGGTVSALAMTRGASSTLYYGTSNGQVYRVDGADTAPAGTVPTLLDMGPDWGGGYVSSIASDPTDDKHLLVSVSNYNRASIFASHDGGNSWTGVEGNLAGSTGPSVRSVAIVPWNNLSIYLAGTSTGLYSTFALDGPGTAWTQEAPELMGRVVVDQLKVRAGDGLVVAGTHGKGVYGLQLQATSGLADELPAGPVVLGQNVPNPFNPRTSISFELPRAAHSSLVVYDVAGHRVKTLVNGQLEGGRHTLDWNGTDEAGQAVSAGVYLYHLRSGEVDEVRRMTLVR